MEIRSLIFSILLFSGVIIGISVWYTGLINAYGGDVQDLSRLNATQKINETISEIEESVRGSEAGGISLLDIPFTIITGIYGALKITLDSLSIFSSLFSEMFAQISLAGWFVGIVVSLVSLVIIFEIMSVVLKKKV